jgi:hypothetical protein
MSRLYMSCALCRRKQAHGLLSSASWAVVEVPGGSAHRVCPSCREANRDWEERVRIAVLQVDDGSTLRVRGAQR